MSGVCALPTPIDRLVEHGAYSRKDTVGPIGSVVTSHSFVENGNVISGDG